MARLERQTCRLLLQILPQLLLKHALQCLFTRIGGRITWLQRIHSFRRKPPSFRRLKSLGRTDLLVKIAACHADATPTKRSPASLASLSITTAGLSVPPLGDRLEHAAFSFLTVHGRLSGFRTTASVRLKDGILSAIDFDPML